MRATWLPTLLPISATAMIFLPTRRKSPPRYVYVHATNFKTILRSSLRENDGEKISLNFREIIFFFSFTFQGWSVRVERAFTRPYPVILFLGIHGIFTSGGTNGRIVVRQMGDEWICTSKRPGICVVTCCCSNALLPLYRDEISSRNRWG